ncbi:MAG: hypothetical protein KVP17_002039 [Porospora cf. gigantea B]|uniref:uncharacterized protein n=2 Tax=Porospora cf. gigantea B TaxID=2853592 RepID=UPI0035718219|nr:MAG: hypothetical protein KVP17_002039 [Porospora cf. gigantea B]
MVRITHELIRDHARQALNPLGDRYLSLRGLKINAIENLGATSDHFACLDLSDNSLTKLDGFPPLQRLRCLVACNNRISRMDVELLSYCLPNLESLVLTNNAFTTLLALRPLGHAKRLERLTLAGNPIQKECPAPVQCPEAPSGPELYRAFLIHHIPSLRFLDRERITEKERRTTRELFGTVTGASLLTFLLNES